VTPRRTAERTPSGRARRRLGILALVVSPIVLSGCTMSSFGAHPGATTTGRQTYHLWQGFTIGAILVGGITLALIVYAAVRYRVRPSDEGVPRQTQYHLPLEIVYTVIPILIVLVLFAFTVVVENDVTALPAPAVTIRVEAFQWGWRFDYPGFTVVGQTTQTPTLEMPEHEDVRIVLRSLDVVHGFYIPAFNFQRQALPGVVNPFTFNAQETGTFFGQCTQYCGLYHSLMWFKVKVVTPAAYVSWLRSNQTAAARLAAIAAAAATAQQLNPNVAVRPDIGGGTN
jgi:cytochrome c oxidase subunit 2